MKNFYLIVGESGAGKTSVGKELEDHYGLCGVTSYTTRAPRFKDEPGYNFVSEMEFNKIPNMVDSTSYSGNYYGTTSEEVDKNDFDVVDLNGIKNFKSNYKGRKVIRVIYLRVPSFLREIRMMDRGDSNENIQKRLHEDTISFKDVNKMADIIIDNDGQFSDCVKKVHDAIQMCEKSNFILKVSFRVLFDLDNVLENFTEMWIRSLNVRHGLHVKIEDLKEYEIEKAFPTLTRHEVYEPLDSDEFLYLLEPIKGSVECLSQLINEGFDVGLCTKTHFKGISAKCAMINYYFGIVGWEHVTITGKKQNVACDVLVDDCPDNFIFAPYYGLLVNYPWNANFKADKVIRVFNFDDIIREIHRMADAKADKKEKKEVIA